jgi:hypothetical protein
VVAALIAFAGPSAIVTTDATLLSGIALLIASSALFLIGSTIRALRRQRAQAAHLPASMPALAASPLRPRLERITAVGKTLSSSGGASSA